MNPGKLIVISSPSGGGKTTIIQQLMEMNSDLSYAVSATTRLPRLGEKEGKDYFFISKQDFLQKIKTNAFLEWAKVHDHYYGTLKNQILNCLQQGKNLLLDIDIQGGVAVKKQLKETQLIFLMPPSMSILEQRLRARGTEDIASLKTRLTAASKEMEAADQYDFIVYNHNIVQAVKDIQLILHQ